MKQQLKKQAASVIIASMVITGCSAYAAQGTSVGNTDVALEPASVVLKDDQANRPYNVTVQGQALSTEGYVQDEHIMVPLREAAEALGFEVTWYQEEQRAELMLPGSPIWTMVLPDVDQYAYNKMNKQLGAAPVNVKGKLFVPASFFHEILRSSVVFEGTQVKISSKVEDVKMHTQQGVITAMNKDEKYPSIQINGTGIDGIILNLDEKTIITNSDGEQVSLNELTLGINIEAKHSLAMTMSLPGQTYAYEITALEASSHAEMLGTSGKIEEVRTDDEGNLSIVVDGLAMSELSQQRVVLNFHKDTMIVDIEGNAVAQEQLTQGGNVLAYYGPMLSKSLPPIGQAWKLVYLGTE